MKNLLTSLALSVAIIAALPSCKKVSPRKLDGKWKVTKGNVSETYEDPGFRKVTNYTSDGTKETGTEVTTFTSGGNSQNVTIDRQVSSTWEFSKDDDTFIVTTTTSGSETVLDVSGFYFKDANGIYVPYSTIGQLDTKITFTETQTQSGVFSITGGAGDVDKNSQIVMKFTEDKKVKNATIKYFNGSSEVTTTLYIADFVNGAFVYNVAPLSENTTSTSTGESVDALIVNVDELKGGVMEVSYKDVQNYTSGANFSKYTAEYKYTLEEE